QVAALGGGVGLDVDGKFDDVQRDVRLGQDVGGHGQDLGMGRGGSAHPDGGAGQRGVVDAVVKAVAGKGGALAGGGRSAGALAGSGGRGAGAAGGQAESQRGGQQGSSQFFHGWFLLFWGVVWGRGPQRARAGVTGSRAGTFARRAVCRPGRFAWGSLLMM